MVLIVFEKQTSLNFRHFLKYQQNGICLKVGQFSTCLFVLDFALFIIFKQFGLNEADILKSSSMMIYWHRIEYLYTNGWLSARINLKQLKRQNGQNGGEQMCVMRSIK